MFALCSTSAFAAVVSNRPSVSAWLEERNKLLVPAFYVLSRVVLYLVLYLVIRSDTAGGDLEAFYYPQADGVLSGKVPGRDFPTAYSPLFPVLLALAYLPFPESFVSAPVLLFILADLACLLLLRCLVRDIVGREFISRATWLFMLCPLTWVVSVHYAQDEILTALVIVAAIHLINKGKCSVAALGTGVGITLTKATTAIVGLALLLRPQPKRNLPESALLIAPLVVVYGLFLYLGANPFTFAGDESGQACTYCITGFLVTLLHELGITSISGVPALLMIVGCPLIGLAVGVALGHKHKLPLHEFLVMVLLSFFLFSLKSLCIYRTWIVCPMIIVALRRRCLPLFALWSLNSAFLMVYAGVPALMCIQPVLSIILEFWLIRLLLRPQPKS